AHTYGLDQPFGPQLFEHRQGFGDAGLEIVDIGVVQVGDVNVVQAQPFQGVLDAAPDAALGEVPYASAGSGNVEALGVLAAAGVRFQHTAHFGGDDKFIPRLVPEDGAKPLFGESQPVVRRGVEVADAGIPCGENRGERLPVRDGPVQVSYACTAEAEPAEAQR